MPENTGGSTVQYNVDPAIRPLEMPSSNVEALFYYSMLTQQYRIFGETLANSFIKEAQGFGRLNAGSRAVFTSSRPPPPRTSLFQLSLFLYGVWP